MKKCSWQYFAVYNQLAYWLSARCFSSELRWWPTAASHCTQWAHQQREGTARLDKQHERCIWPEVGAQQWNWCAPYVLATDNGPRLGRLGKVPIWPTHSVLLLLSPTRHICQLIGHLWWRPDTLHNFIRFLFHVFLLLQLTLAANFKTLPLFS